MNVEAIQQVLQWDAKSDKAGFSLVWNMDETKTSCLGSWRQDYQAPLFISKTIVWNMVKAKLAQIITKRNDY